MRAPTLDPARMQQEGDVTVHLKGHRDQGGDLNDKSDPYVKVGVGGKKQSRVKATLANWNETISLAASCRIWYRRGCCSR